MPKAPRLPKIAKNAKNGKKAKKAKISGNIKIPQNPKSQESQKCQYWQKCHESQVRQDFQHCREWKDCEDCKDCRGCQDCREWKNNISKSVQNLGLYWKKTDFSERNIDFQSKWLRVVEEEKKMLWNVYQMFFSRMYLPAFFLRFFSSKNQKILNVGKIGSYNEKRMFFGKKKRFHLFKTLLQKNWKRQKMSVVAVRLLLLNLESLTFYEIIASRIKTYIYTC